MTKHDPDVKQLTSRNCPLLNCESVLCGIEADDQCLRHDPLVSGKAQSKSRPRGCRGRNLHDQKWAHRALLWPSLDGGNWSRVARGYIRGGIIVVLFYSLPVWAVNPQNHISQYGHSVWRIQEGYFNGQVSAVAQTIDGCLWLQRALTTFPIRHLFARVCLGLRAGVRSHHPPKPSFCACQHSCWELQGELHRDQNE
jgi:hypothetical protein